MIQIAENVNVNEGFKVYVDDVRVLNGTSPIQSEIQAVAVDDVAGHVIPFTVTVEKSNPTITWGETYLKTLPWCEKDTLIDKPNE